LCLLSGELSVCFCVVTVFKSKCFQKHHLNEMCMRVKMSCNVRISQCRF
jgi:hypothetical protein